MAKCLSVRSMLKDYSDDKKSDILAAASDVINETSQEASRLLFDLGDALNLPGLQLKVSLII